MPSKGVDLYGYKVADGQSTTFKLREPGASNTDSYSVSSSNEMYTKHLEVNSDLPFHLKGDYSFEAGSSVSRSCEINSLTGNISDSDMDNMLTNQQCVTYSDGIVSYGFYDAGSGYGGESYTSHHQNYAYIGDTNRADWMYSLVQNSIEVGTKPFSTFVLPGGHDVGMNTSSKIAEVASNAKSIAAVMTLLVGWLAGLFGVAASAVVYVLGGLATSLVELIMVNLGITQKDSITNMLNMGVRYFDFRPGYMAKVEGIAVASGDGLYHQHNFLPGMAFTDFLNEIVSWMKEHEGEIVVVSLGFSGFYDKAMKPTAEILTSEIQSAIGSANIVAGDISDVSSSYNDLIAANKRLLFFNNGVGVNDASKYDSYSDDAYSTLVPAPIITALNSMEPSPPSGDQYTVLQLQGTASAVSSLWPKLALCTSDSTSPLLMTKAYFDSCTYAWANSNLNSFNSNYPLVILNDFVDPVMSQLAETATLARSKQMHYVVTLPQGDITITRNHTFVGSHTSAAWAPFNPDNAGGWKDGDTLTVVCTFNLNPDISPLPVASDYWGLCVGACSASNQAEITDLENLAYMLPFSDRVGALLGSNISSSSSATSQDIFFGATSTATTIALSPSSRGTLTNYVYKWVMTYNGSNTVVSSGTDVEIVYGYGDPQHGEDQS